MRPWFGVYWLVAGFLMACSGPEVRKNGHGDSSNSNTGSGTEAPKLSATELYAQALKAERESTFEEAQKAYSHVLEAEPGHLSALLNAQRLAVRTGTPAADVLASARAHASAHPEHPELLAGVIEALLFSEAYTEAETEARAWVTREPDAFEGHFYFAYALVAQNQRLSLARESLLWINERHPERAEGFWLYAVLLIQQDETFRAGMELERALELRPDYAEAHLAAGVLAQRLRRFEDAEAHCHAAVEAAPSLREAHLHHGHSLRLLGRNDDASAAYTRALELSPGWDAAQKALYALP